MGRGLDGFFDTRCGDCVVLRDRGRHGLSPFSGGFGEGETPLPIPNRAVKPLSADGTWPARAWESRTPPVYLTDGSPSGGPFVVTRPFTRRLPAIEPPTATRYGADTPAGARRRGVR